MSESISFVVKEQSEARKQKNKRTKEQKKIKERDTQNQRNMQPNFLVVDDVEQTATMHVLRDNAIRR